MNEKTQIYAVIAIAIVFVSFGAVITFINIDNISNKTSDDIVGDYNPSFRIELLNGTIITTNVSKGYQILICFADILETDPAEKTNHHWNYETLMDTFPDAHLYTLVPEDLDISVEEFQDWIDSKKEISYFDMEWTFGFDIDNSYRRFNLNDSTGMVHINDDFLPKHARNGEPDKFTLEIWLRDLKIDFPSIVFTAMNGSVLSTYASYGKVIIIDFWATWCSPCRTQMEDLRQVYAEYSNKCEIYSISTDLGDSLADIRDYADAEDMTWVVGSDTLQVNDQYWNVTAIPTLYVLDTEMNIVAHHVGTTSYTSLAATIDAYWNTTDTGGI